MTGATSEAYCAATLWKAPHGIPMIVSAVFLNHALGVKLTAEHLACNQHLDVGSKEQGEDGCYHHDQEPYSRLLRAIAVGDPTSDDQTDNLTGTRTIRQARLPCWGDCVFFGLRVPMAILLVEDG